MYEIVTVCSGRLVLARSVVAIALLLSQPRTSYSDVYLLVCSICFGFLVYSALNVLYVDE